MKTLKSIIIAIAVLSIYLSAYASGDTVKFATRFDPAPTLTTTSVGYDIYINRDAETFRAASFSVSVNAILNEADSLKFFCFDQGGNISTENIQYTPAIDNYRTNSEFTVYNFSIHVGDNSSRIHRSDGSTSDLYKLFRIIFKKGWGAEDFQTNSRLEFMIDNIAISKNNSHKILPVKAVNGNTSTETIFYTFRPDGDVNNDGVVNILDVTPIAKHIIKIAQLIGTAKLRADVAPPNAPDNIINILDLNGVLLIIAGEYYMMENGRLIILPLKGEKKFHLTNVSSIFFESTGNDNIKQHIGLEKAFIEYDVSLKNMSAEFKEIQREINVEFFTQNEISGFAICQESISDVQQSNIQNLPCYPNPAKDYITIDNPYAAATLIIMDASGREISRTQTTKNKITYNTEQLSSGSYFYCLQTDSDGSLFSKFIINK